MEEDAKEGLQKGETGNENYGLLEQWYSTFFVRVPPDIISLQLCTPKVVGV
jgi:hypothetical protein